VASNVQMRRTFSSGPSNPMKAPGAMLPKGLRPDAANLKSDECRVYEMRKIVCLEERVVSYTSAH
jgi:hypothetical protein